MSEAIMSGKPPGGWIMPDWPAPPWVHAVITTRHDGLSIGPYASLNLGDHVGDDPIAVAHNRQRLATALGLPADPLWLKQVHGCDVALVGKHQAGCSADAAVAFAPDQVCAVLTADCLPLLLCDRQGQRVAAVHAGWRGLAAGVIETTIDAIGVAGSDLLAWLGPAIGPQAFAVGAEVRDIFLTHDPRTTSAFQPSSQGRWLADIYALARCRLEARGVGFIGGGNVCTASDPERFFSYRRDGVTGRMASLIWERGCERLQ